jgi:sulfoxide reductase heme-binding subunit YedZ
VAALKRATQFRWVYKPLVFAACSVPAVLMTLGILVALGKLDHGGMDLGADPVKRLIHACGITALNLLLITLAVTPLRMLTHWNDLIRLRRMLGLFAFFYVVLHFLAYSWLDMGFDLDTIAHDIPKRPFALVGFAAFVLMIPLAATSFNRAIKALGAKRWQMLHKLVYATVLLGLLHFFWMKAAKNNFAEVSVYAVIIAVLLGWRVKQALRRT